MDIKELGKKYNLTSEDIWKLEIRNKDKTKVIKTIWILKHDAVEKISNLEGIELLDIKPLFVDKEQVTLLISMKKRDKKIMSIGEANKGNCESRYLGAMAEKRGIDRCVLKLINAYEYGIHSDSESEDFKRK